MRVQYAFCADAAQYTADGKLWVLGGDLEHITATTFPAVHPILALVLKFWLEPSEVGLEHTLRVELRDSNAAVIGGIDVPPFATKPDSAPPEPGAGFRIALQLQGVVFPKAATYSFFAIVNGREVARVPIMVKLPAGGDDTPSNPPTKSVGGPK